MPKITEFPGLRTHTRKGKNGQVWVSYAFDGRRLGTRDIALGSDWNQAVERWREITNGTGRIYKKPKRVARRLPGRRRKFEHNLWDELPDWGKRTFLNAERRAAKYAQPFLLTVDDLAEAIRRANGHCEISGIEFEGVGTRHPFAPSVDRIDSRIGYQKGNIRIVCLIANYAMNTWGHEPLKRLSEHIWRNQLAERCGNDPGTIVLSC